MAWAGAGVVLRGLPSAVDVLAAGSPRSGGRLQGATVAHRKRGALVAVLWSDTRFVPVKTGDAYRIAATSK